MSAKSILLITNDKYSGFANAKNNVFTIFAETPADVALVRDLEEKPTHIYYDFDKMLSRPDYHIWVNSIRAKLKQICPGIPVLKANLFLTCWGDPRHKGIPAKPTRRVEKSIPLVNNDEMTHPSHPAAYCPEKTKPNDGWVIIFKDTEDTVISQDLMADIFKRHKYVHQIISMRRPQYASLISPQRQREDMASQSASDFLDDSIHLLDLTKYTGKIYIYNYCDDPANAIRVANISDQQTEQGKEVIYHISVDFNQGQSTMQNNEELKYEPTTSEPKTNQIVYAFVEHLSENDRKFLEEVGSTEGVHLQVYEQEHYSSDTLSKLVRGMSVPQLVLFFNVRDGQKEKIIDVLRKNDVGNLVSFADIAQYPQQTTNETGKTHIAHVLWQATRPPRDWFELMDKKHGEPFKFEKEIPNRLAGLTGDYDGSVWGEKSPMVYEFEEAIQMIKTGNVAMRALNSPVDSFVSATPASELTPDKFWSKFNKACAEKQKIGTLNVNSSFTRFLGSPNGVTMGWTPSNEDMWGLWVMEGTALFPSSIGLTNDMNELDIQYDLYRGRSVLSDTTAFAGPFHLVYDTIFDPIRNGAKVGFLTNAGDYTVDFNRCLLSTILNNMIDTHDYVVGETSLPVHLVMEHETGEGPHLHIEHTINFCDDEKYTQHSEALWNELKEEEIEVLIVDLDAFEYHPLKDDILQKLGWLSEQQENFHWVALSLENNIVYGDEAMGVEVIDLGDGPQESA